MRCGLDIDGVFCDFNKGFIREIRRVTGRDLFPPGDFAIPCWDYPQHFGYSEEEIAATWADIRTNAFFWLALPEYAHTRHALNYFQEQKRKGAEIYFITARQGIRVKEQTELWLKARDFPNPTVLISDKKGWCAVALDLDVFVDDRDNNILDVVSQRGARTSTFLYSQPWNTSSFIPHSAVRVSALDNLLDSVVAP